MDLTLPVSPPPYQRFSTRGIKTRNRIGLWEQHNARALVGLECRSLNADVFDAVEINVALPRLNFAKVGAGAHVVERNQKRIDDSPSRGVALYFALEGESFFYHPGGVQLQRPGTLLICDAQQPFMRGFAKGLKELVVTVPHELFRELSGADVPSAPIVHSFGDAGKNGSTLAAATAWQMANLVHSTVTRPHTADSFTVEETALSLLRDLYRPDIDLTPQSHRRVALAWIRHRIRDPHLTVAAVAEGIGLSERHLSRVFRETGKGVARTILEMRLELANRVLSLPGSPPVNEVAFSCGFSSAAHFSRAFRTHYGYAPSEAHQQR